VSRWGRCSPPRVAGLLGETKARPALVRRGLAKKASKYQKLNLRHSIPRVFYAL